MKIFTYDPDRRLTAKQALKHPLFYEMYKRDKRIMYSPTLMTLTLNFILRHKRQRYRSIQRNNFCSQHKNNSDKQKDRKT